MKKKLVVIGIDGSTSDVILPLIKKGVLPNLNKLKSRGVLRSVIPPVTATAWASFITGNRPGKTEIYDFTVVDSDSWKSYFVSRKRLRGKPLWKFLDMKKLRSCFINMPMTYPPEKINGFMISGIETPSRLHDYVYPKYLKKELNKRGYKIEISTIRGRNKIVREAKNILDKRIEIAKYLFRKNFDFFFVLFRASDIVQHYAWNKKDVEEVYKKIDNFIGSIGDKNDVIVISDHGFEKINKAFNANAWLEKQGYLKMKKIRKNLLAVLGIRKEKLLKIIDKLKLKSLIRLIPRKIGKKIPTEKTGFEEALALNLIDFDKTKAIAKRAVKSAQIYLNKEKRGGIIKESEEEKLKREIKNRLERFFKKEKIKVKIWTKEELYGKKTKYAPDLTLYIEEKGYDTHCFFSSDKKIWVGPIAKQDAEHNLNGIIFSNLNLNLKKAEIIDLSPTILNYYKIKAGKFDGKSLL